LIKKYKTIFGNFVTPETISKKRISIDLESGLILHVEENAQASTKDNYSYNDDCLIFSAMGDIHIHAREDQSKKHIYKEDFQSACMAAFNGGVAHVGDMPNNPIPPIDDESYCQKVLLSKNIPLSFLMYAGVGPKTSPLSFKVPYKAFMGPSIGELFFDSKESLELAIAKYKHQNISFHCEDPDVLKKNADKTNHFERRPIEAENLATEFALQLIAKYQLDGKLCHYSSGVGLDLIIKAKEKGVKVKAEVTPQHLFFSKEKILHDYKNEEILFQMNPPIRSEEDRERLIWGLKNGHIDYLATDHAPHSKNEKEKGISGMIGLDTYALTVSDLINKENVDPKIIAKVSSKNPGDFFNQFLPDFKNVFSHYEKLGNGFGHIEKNYVGSFTVINLKKAKLFTSKDIKSKASWSPFINYHFSGSLEDFIHFGQKISL
jgi:dihydroorotase